jgi:hypothetical protein
MEFNGEGLFSEDSEVEDFDIGHFFSNVFKSRTASQEATGARPRSPGYRDSAPKTTTRRRAHHEPMEGHVGTPTDSNSIGGKL